MLKKPILLAPVRIEKKNNENFYHWSDSTVRVRSNGGIVTADLMSYRDIFVKGTVVEGEIQCVQVEYENNNVEIMLVYIKKNSHICTKAVGRTMLALMTFLETENLTVATGDVTVVSKNAVAAFVCYCKAFLANGFYVNKYSDVGTVINLNVNKMFDQIKSRKYTRFHLTFKYIGNTRLRF